MGGLRRVLGSVACIIVIATAGGSAAWAQDEPSPTGLVVPTADVKASKATEGYTGSIEVANPTASDITVLVPGAASDGTSSVCVLTGEPKVVPAHRSAVLTVNFKAGEGGCVDPIRSEQVAVFAATGGDAGPTTEQFEVTVAQGVAATEEPEATGISWPKDPIFLTREDQGLKGEIQLFNPTGDSIFVKFPVFPAGCEPPKEERADTEIKAHSVGRIELAEVPPCSDLDMKAISLVLVAHNADESKSDSALVLANGAVDWGDLPIALLWIAAAAGIIALASAQLYKGEAEWFGPILVAEDAPTSWLTGIATIGTAFAALAANSDMIKRLLGLEPIPQMTLVVAGGLVAVASVALAGVVTNIPVRKAVVGDKEQQCVTIAQFVIGAAITAFGVGVQVWTIDVALKRLELPVGDWLVDAGCFLAYAMLAIYLAKSVSFYVAEYGTAAPSEPKKPSADLIASVAQAIAPHFIDASGVPPAIDVDGLVKKSTEVATALVAPAPAPTSAPTSAPPVESMAKEPTRRRPVANSLRRMI